MVWDIVVVSHEIGHNFNSSHTHCYAGVGGNANDIDHCYGSEGGCYAGSTSLPGGCPGSGMGCGTIMSYCHLLSGGYGNLSLTFGANHPYGIEPGRVPVVMNDHVVNRAAVYPGCLDVIAEGPTLTVSTAGGGSGTVTSNPTGIDCGTDSTESYADNTVVTLTATPDAGSSFAGFSGDADCSDGSVTMDASKGCSATFILLCGNGVLDSGEACDGSDLGGATCGGCAGTPTCNSDCTIDTSGCTNGVCDASETCASCPLDCTGTGSSCGDGVCEAGDGEDCVSCPSDCNGKGELRYRVLQGKVKAGAPLDGIYIIRTSLPKDVMSADDAVRKHKRLARIEKGFRSMKTVSLNVRSIYHRTEERVRAHVLLCMLAYYVEWHLRHAWAPLLFAEETDTSIGRDPVAKAKPSLTVRRKVSTKTTDDGLPVHSLRSLLRHVSSIVISRCRRLGANSAEPTFDVCTRHDAVHARAFDLIATL